jgi:O-antigen/teichoic acid export membrane protein
VLAKLVSIELIGTYGLILATISFAVMLIGADFYVYAQREMLKRDESQWFWVLMQQTYAQIGLYVVFLPFGILLFVFKILSWKLMILFYLLLVLEHISQEINRVLVVIHKQIQASTVLFIRKALWMFPVLCFIYIDKSYASISFILWSWIAGCFVSILVGVFSINKNITMSSLPALDSVWIKKGLKLAGLFLIATLCLKGLTTFDKYSIEVLGGKETLGIYVLYMTIVFGAYSFLDPAVYSFLYPRLLSSYNKDMKTFNKTFRELFYSTVFVGLLIGIIIYLTTPVLLSWIEKEEYISYLNILYVIIVAGYVSNLEVIPHYYLYAAKADKWIICSYIFSLCVFLIIVFIGEHENALETVSYALLSAYLSILFIKTIGYLKISLKEESN